MMTLLLAAKQGPNVLFCMQPGPGSGPPTPSELCHVHTGQAPAGAPVAAKAAFLERTRGRYGYGG
jgi:hypothetical protein